MKVLSIGSDKKLFELGSAVYERIKEYGSLVEELHIINMVDAHLGFKEMRIGENVWIYPTNSRSKFFRPLDALRMGKKVLEEKRFIRGKSLITTQDIESGWVGMRLKKKFRAPLEVQLHTNPFSPYFTGFQNTVRKIFLKSILKSADAVRVVSEELKREVEKVIEANVHVLPIFVDRGRLERAPITFDLHKEFGWSFIILMVARLTEEKNVPLALEILNLVCQKFPNTGLVIVGSGPEEKNLKILVEKLQLQSSVAFVGWQEDLASYYKTANIFLQTSFFEGYGLALVEAGVSGLPVVTTNVGIAHELENKEDAYIYSEIDMPQTFAEGIVDLLEHNEKREFFKTNMLQSLKEKLISKNEYLSRLKGIWESIVNPESSQPKNILSEMVSLVGKNPDL